ncbi:MAG: hypothetical protein D6711_10690 [Chloroflexi bacterium]|nr:MAG: hypothetical protein D6711_10690 [Chloroflexota bacterium]
MEKWRLTLDNIRTDYPVVEKVIRWKAPEPPQVHPESPIYKKFWSREAYKCIEGYWAKDFDGYRYMPGTLYYFYNYFIIEHTEEVDGVKETKEMKPYLLDYFWEIAYMDICAYGFSGFAEDLEISCNKKILEYREGKISESKLPDTCFINNDKSTGKLKKYEDAYEYLLRRHKKPYKYPLYQNDLMNYMILGTRGGGKSYWEAARIEHMFVFGGAGRYNEAFINNRLAGHTVVGSSESAKSAELLNKVVTSLTAKAKGDNPLYKKWFGIYEYTDKDGNKSYIPCPFYRYYTGSLDCPNKKNLFRAEYKRYNNGRWEMQGVGSSIAHVSYSNQKAGKSGHRAAEGGRYNRVVYEEVGSMENFIEALGANEGTVIRSGVKFGVQVAIGTSGNIKFIVAAKKVFLNPQDYNFMSFKNKFSQEGKNGRICYFLPYYMTLLDCKDENGNTDYEKAIAQVNKERKKKAKSEDPKVLRDFLMNHPCFVREMWFNDEGYYFPIEELMERERQLLFKQEYKKLGTPVKLYKRPDNKVGYKVLNNVEPIVDFPLPNNIDTNGCIVIYEHPIRNAPEDMYNLIGYDPYVEDDIDRGGSLAVTYIVKNPKYASQGYNTNIIVASYIGKPKEGIDYYHRNQELLIEYYGNPPRSLWLENNRGERVVAYYKARRKEQLLAIRYGALVDAKIRASGPSVYGYRVGNRIDKLTYIGYLNEWLLQETTHILEDGTEETLPNLYRIPCLFLIRQLIQYNLKDNFDAVSAMLGIAIAVNQMEKLEELGLQNKKSKLAPVLTNKRIFGRNQKVYTS